MGASEPKPDYQFENGCVGPVCGIDEAGRGPLAGPVVAAAVILDLATMPDGLDDSKRLTARRREHLAGVLERVACVGIGLATVDEIDRLNILHATMLAMRRAAGALAVAPRTALIDGNRAPDLGCATQTVIKGDQRSLSIAAASIIAKVHRDRIMTKLDAEFPHFGWARNAGYPTREHREALARFGPCAHHRTSFAPVRAAIARHSGFQD
ncbi:MAG: ribonuclease HII [Alphaproteobacteria bacterium]